jgi:transcription elongation factor GreA
MQKQYLTQESFEEFKKELETLKTAKRAEIAQRLKIAKEYGDLSENSEYSEAREEQANVESRIFELEELLKNASIVTKQRGGETVDVGSTIVVKKGEKTTKYSIVGSYEANPQEGNISDESPLGKAFLKRKAGDKVEVATPGGKMTYEILSIE